MCMHSKCSSAVFEWVWWTDRMNACWRTKKDREAKHETAFMRNGRELLEKLVASGDSRRNPLRSFSAKELKQATNNYDETKVLSRDSGYKLYRGFLQGRTISVKKFVNEIEQYEYSFNDIVFASQMSTHKNFLKLLGCCLETKIPILVFEPVENRTLADHIYGPNKTIFEPLQWIQRLKIAMEMANAVAYLHTAFPKPIIFRNIKPLNILLDEHGVAKLSDFSISIPIPEGESHVHDLVAGAPGLIAPEYLKTGFFNEKQDVFNFGAFLLVLLTGQTAADDLRLEHGGEFYLVNHVKKYIDNDRFNDIVDPVISGDLPWSLYELLLQSFKAVAVRCISDSAECRPTMVEVAKELRQIHQLAIYQR